MSDQLTAGVKQDDMVDRGDVSQEKVQYIANAVKAKCVIVDARQLLVLLGNACRTQGYALPIVSTTINYDGCCCRLSWRCAAGHVGDWCSSAVTGTKAVLPNNTLFGASILLSGNSFQKIQLFCEFLGLNCVSTSTYYRCATFNPQLLVVLDNFVLLC